MDVETLRELHCLFQTKAKNEFQHISQTENTSKMSPGKLKEKISCSSQNEIIPAL